ncbi:hypothetical protein FRC04_009493 [Tulasnella sp. 424]|nr:hypothetical protein FRC04_009493 [Tulasnella sp. 424]
MEPKGLIERPSNLELQNAKAESLEQRLEALDLDGPQSTPQSQEPRTTKLSARDILEGLASKRLEITQIRFIGDNSIAKGGHGDVMVANLVLEDGSPLELERKVAVKKFQVNDSTDEDKFLRGFVNELHVVNGLSHLNIVKIIGFVEDVKKRIAWLVFPWEANGNVREFLLFGTWELAERVSLIKDVASGLSIFILVSHPSVTETSNL